MRKRSILLLTFIISFFIFNSTVLANNLASCGNVDNIPAKITNISRFLFQLIKYITPVVIVLMGSIDFFKAVVGSDSDMLPKSLKSFGKRLIAGAIVFLIMMLFQIILPLVSNDGSITECLSCFLVKAESCSYYEMKEKIIDDSDPIEGYENNKKVDEKDYGDITIDKNKGVEGCRTIVVNSTEPNPSIAINYWKTNGKTFTNFYYPKVESTGELLGAWPANYSSYLKKITAKKTYLNGNLIWPVDVKSQQSYEHSGIDIPAEMGTPIYSPVNGKLMYSEWGHTINKGCDETAYTVMILLDKPIVYEGKTYKQAFLTHMSGIVYRCNTTNQCNRSISQGDLIGFVGNAVGSPSVAGFVPHLHFSLCASGCADDNNIWNAKMFNIYNIKSGEARKAGQ